jgi:Holliday junction resolvasome RuvABC endonuclease subunit
VTFFIVGIDPGVSGAVAFYSPSAPDRIAVDDAPVAGGEISAPHLASMIRRYAPSMAVIERVNAFPGQGVSSVFNFGRSYGDVRGVVGALNIPLHAVSPQKWKKHFGLSADKDQSRMLAVRLFPAVADHFKLKKHHGRAEAALIALYGAQVLCRQDAA